MSITSSMLAQMRAEIAPVKTETKPRAKSPERDLQVAVLGYLANALPSDAVVWATPNGQKRSGYERREFIALGGVAGIPDLFVLYRGMLIGLELKSKRGRLKASQEVMGQRLRQAGARWAVCRSVEAVEWALDCSGIPLKARVSA